MTVTINHDGQIVLQKKVHEKLDVRAGDVLVVVLERRGRIVLRKKRLPRRAGRRSVHYLTPPPLSPRVLKRIYARPDLKWDKVEAEAVTQGRRVLAGRRLEEL